MIVDKGSIFIHSILIRWPSMFLYRLVCAEIDAFALGALKNELLDLFPVSTSLSTHSMNVDGTEYFCIRSQINRQIPICIYLVYFGSCSE